MTPIPEIPSEKTWSSGGKITLKHALTISIVFHVILIAWLMRSNKTVAKVPEERLVEIDLRDGDFKRTEKPRPTVAPAPTPQRLAKLPPIEAPLPAAPLPDFPPPAIVTLPPPTPQPTLQAKPPAQAPKPTLSPEKPIPTPPAQAPQPIPPPRSMPEKVPTQAPPTQNLTPGNRKTTAGSTRTKQDDTPERFAGANRHPQPGSGRPTNNRQNRTDEQAGNTKNPQRFSDSFNRGPTKRPTSGDSFANTQTNQPAPGGENNADQSTLPRGVRSGRRDAANPDLDSGQLPNRTFGKGTSGGRAGTGALGNAQGGSARGRNSELAGTDGAGGETLPRAVPRSGGTRRAGRNDQPFVEDPESRDMIANAPGPSSPGSTRARGRDNGAGVDSGAGDGFAYSGPNRAALRTRPGSGLGAGSGSGVGGAPGRKRGGGGEIAGAGDGRIGDGGFGNGRGGNVGDGSGGGGGRRGPRLAGVPFGDPNGSDSGNPNGGGGTEDGPGGPGKGTRLARRGLGDNNGDGGNGTGDGLPGRSGRGGRGGGGHGIGPGTGPGNTSGDGGNGPGGGNGSGSKGDGGMGGRRGRGTGDGDRAGIGDGPGGSVGVRRSNFDRGQYEREREKENSIGRGLWFPGLVGTYYQDPDQGILDPGHKIDWPTLGQSGSKMVRRHTEKTIDFNWETDAPLPGMRGTYWSVRWTGRIFVPKTGVYRFYLEDVDDGGRLYLNGTRIVNVWLVQRSSPGSGKITLEKGAHEITLEYVQGPATASSVRLMWESDSFPRELVGSYKPG